MESKKSKKSKGGNKSESKKQRMSTDICLREQHNLALTLDVTAPAHSQGMTGVVAEYGKSYLINGFAAQMIKRTELNFGDTRDLAFRLVMQDKLVLGVNWIDLAPFLTLPTIYDLPLTIEILCKSILQVELRNTGETHAAVRFTFVGTGVRNLI